MSCFMNSSLTQFKNRIRLLETHDPSTTEIIRAVTSTDGSTVYHGQWVSGLTQTTVLGVPDTELITPLTRANMMTTNAQSVGLGRSQRSICTAFDADSGGPVEEIPTLIRTLARKGVSMIIIEDKEVNQPGMKVNSLATSSASQGQANPQEFGKVMATFQLAKQRQNLDGVLITARIESFTCRKVIKGDPEAEKASVDKALKAAMERAEIYRNAGADAIMIHSKSKAGDEVLAFLRQFREKDAVTPLVVVPTTYGSTHEDALYTAGANVIIYANHLMRAKIHAVDSYIAASPTLDDWLTVSQYCPASLHETLAARNHGYLLRSLQTMDLAHLPAELRQLLADVERVSATAMEDAARRLLDGKTAGAVDAEILPVKELLGINAVHLSDLGRQDATQPTAAAAAAGVSEDNVSQLVNPVVGKVDGLLREVTA